MLILHQYCYINVSSCFSTALAYLHIYIHICQIYAQIYLCVCACVCVKFLMARRHININNTIRYIIIQLELTTIGQETCSI